MPKTVMVVEDHPALRELIRCFLAGAGYRVHGVGSPGEAEALWDREGEGIDLLVTDLVMPGKSGRTLAAALILRKPSLKTLYISGYALGTGPEKKVEGPYLQKPFTRLELLHMVESIFDGAEPRPATGNGSLADGSQASQDWSAHADPRAAARQPVPAPAPADRARPA